MATDIKEAGKGHNSGNRDPKYIASQVQKLDKELEPLEDQRRELNEAMKKLRHTFKAETGITVADFTAARRLAKMEDEGEREEKCGNLKTCYNALSVGHQLDWVTADQKAAA